MNEEPLVYDAQLEREKRDVMNMASHLVSPATDQSTPRRVLKKAVQQGRNR